MITHICNNYISSKVHRELVSNLAAKGVKQRVFIPIRRNSDNKKNFISSDLVFLIYKKYPGLLLKYFPLLKLIWVYFLFENHRGKEEARDGRKHVVLAHTLWSDGVIAYFNKIVHGTPYVIVVRNTDLNWFIPKLPHYRWLVKKVIAGAKDLVFIGSAYEGKFKNKYPKLYGAALSVVVLPNGLERFWIDNKLTTKQARSNVVFYAGRFDQNKNLPAMYLAVQKARMTLPNLELHLAGGSLIEFQKLTGLKDVPSWVKVKGIVSNKSELLKLYRMAGVFLMPSFHETFGLVYLEALSQGCPYIYTKGEGADGLVGNADFAVGVEPSSINDIQNSILTLLAKYPFGVAPEQIASCLRMFDWDSISDAYLSMVHKKT